MDEPKRQAAITAVYDALHKDKLGAHWLWCVIEKIAAGQSEDEAMDEFGYFRRAAVEAAQPGSVGETALPMDTAPKDATMLRLLVEFEEGSFEDDPAPCWTIGTNHMANTSVDEWLFAGWNWTHDCFTQGTGKPIGWLPLLAAAPTEAKPAQDAVDADDPLQGAVDWLLQADGEFFCVATVQRTLRIGYNRANRLSEVAKERAAISAKKGG